MTTRLAGEQTRFLPFNRGSQPRPYSLRRPATRRTPSGYRTGYFWQEVLERERFLEILGSYMFVERRDEKVEDDKGARTVTRETLIFPRYHQLDAVGRLVAAAAADGPGRNYLIQHSAGSGKTNSISWLSHRLASLHDTADAKVYHCVVVITDRRVLDRQLQDAVYQIEHAQGVVKAIDQDSKQLASALVDGTMIVITTLQKFPFVMGGLLRVAGADVSEEASEAEQSQAAAWAQVDRRPSLRGDRGRSALQPVGRGRPRDEGDSRLAGAVHGRGRRRLARRAERGGRVARPAAQPLVLRLHGDPKGQDGGAVWAPGSSGKPEAFHVYSMRQAIE